MHRSPQGALAPPSRSQTPAPSSNPSSGLVSSSLSGCQTCNWTGTALFGAFFTETHDAKLSRFAKNPRCRNTFEMLPFWSLGGGSPGRDQRCIEVKTDTRQSTLRQLDSQATCHLLRAPYYRLEDSSHQSQLRSDIRGRRALFLPM